MQVFKVEQWMNKNVKTLSKNNNAFEAAELMNRCNIGCILVVENDEPIGIISERDIVRKVVARKMDPYTTTIEQIMTMSIISAELDMDIKDVGKTMVKYNIKKMPVVENNKLKGIITTTDIIRILSQFNKLYDAKDIIELGS